MSIEIEDSKQTEELSELDAYTQARMSFLEHLADLRRRLVYSLIAGAIGFGICWFFVHDLFQWLLAPLQVAAPEAGLAQMHHKDMAEPFFTLLKTAIVGGIFLAIPAILYNIWKFVAPGLYPGEKRMVVPFVVMATFFFFVGGSFCYFLVIPYGYRFLLDFSLQVSQPTLMMSEYFAMTTKLLLGFGVVFEMPVVAMFLSAMGVITHRTLLKHWRMAFVASFIVAAMLTPPDVVTQAMMAGPLIVLYAISVAIAWFFTRRREAKAAALEASLEA
ncbi:MAG: twin-arginine translocase subunit TatC [Bradymonadaceae bacterium]|nr:twin-arginine translocase subunit TatC [Lujinxingiaceae bacterium]